MPDGQVHKATSYEQLFGDLLQEKHPTRTVEVRGEQIPIDRYELSWSALEIFHPLSADQLAALRFSRARGKQTREQKRWEKENPLLAWMERVQTNESGEDKGRS
jgi:hypothetical protein